MSKSLTAGEQEQKMDAVVRKYAESLWASDQDGGHTPLDALMAKEEMGTRGSAMTEEEVYRVRCEAYVWLLDFFFADGPNPLCVIRRVLSLVKAIKPELIGDMSCEDVAVLCDDTGRATVSARIKRIYTRFLEGHGAKVTKARFQKSDDAVRRYRAAQKGNRNRKGTGGKRKDSGKKRG
jgi:hypothetical protein